MPRERLLNLLDEDARRAFDEARLLAREHGGVLSPIHLLVALLERSDATDTNLLRATRQALATHFGGPSAAITVSKETQAVLAGAGRLAAAEGRARATSVHLLRAAFESDAAKQALEADHKPAARPLSGALRDYCADLAEESQAAGGHAFVGREREITAVLETLCRKLKNNPLLIGPPGVGKTALVTAVSARLRDGNVPPRLRGKRILEVSRLRLVAGAKYTGEIEKRLKELLAEVRAAGDVILFFDELHTLLNAGGPGGTGDVANLLKTALSKGDITCIGATTLAEYFKHIARDEALARRFSTINIDEPSREETLRILTQSVGAFETYHGVRIDEEVLTLIVDLAERYLHSRSFPDKAFDLLDRAAAKAALAGSDRMTRESVTETLSETTGLPLEIMDEDPATRLERLESFLNDAVPGQPRAAHDIARVVRIAKLRLELRPEQPDGVFLFVGPDGVGKHEMAEALAKFLYGSTRKMIEFDMSQFTESHSLARLIGAEPGYVGYGERSGLLSKAAEEHPHSVLYFKNIDMAHSVVQQFLGEAFEQGRFTDAAGSRHSLSNTTVVMSLSRIAAAPRGSNIGFFSRREENEGRRGRRRGTGDLGRAAKLAEALAATIDEVIEFQVLDRAAIEQLVSESLAALAKRLAAAQPVTIQMSSDLAGYFADRLAAEHTSLAQLERLLQETIVLPFTRLKLERRDPPARCQVAITVEDGAVAVRAI